MSSYVALVWCMFAMAGKLASSQDDPSAYLFQGSGHIGRVVDATGCTITYELACTLNNTVVCNDVPVSLYR